MPAKKQIPREKILAAAFEMLRDGGIAAVNVKALAQRLNCSSQPIYLSFTGMEELRAALASEAVSYFLRRLGFDQEAGGAHLYGMDYIRFAREESELFKFLFMRRNAFEEMKSALKPVIERSMAPLMERYRIDHEEAHHFHDQLWMHTHGIAAMAATSYCDWDMGKVKRMLAECETYLSRKYQV